MTILLKIKTLLTTLLLFGMMTMNATDKIIPTSEIPNSIKTYVKTHFPKQSITKAEIDIEGTKKEYEIKLNNLTELKFDANYKIRKIDANVALPATVIPAKIRTYIKTNYPNQTITDWELKANSQEIELDNGLELNFSLNGDFTNLKK